jgi:hypothetical protein
MPLDRPPRFHFPLRGRNSNCIHRVSLLVLVLALLVVVVVLVCVRLHYYVCALYPLIDRL